MEEADPDLPAAFARAEASHFASKVSTTAMVSHSEITPQQELSRLTDIIATSSTPDQKIAVRMKKPRSVLRLLNAVRGNGQTIRRMLTWQTDAILGVNQLLNVLAALRRLLKQDMVFLRGLLEDPDLRTDFLAVLEV